jgi:uncharacterized protein (TIGR04255 family)
MENPNNVYNNAPIIVVILQFRYDKIEDFNIEKIKVIAKKINKRFPNTEPQIVQGITIDNNDKETTVSLDEKRIDGIRISSKDKLEYFTITKEVFTFQSNKKYLGWEDIIDSIREFWTMFSSEFNIHILNRISLRYVNKINLPQDVKELTKYFTTYLKDDKNTYNISNFQFRFSSFDKENNFTIHIGHALEKQIGEAIPYLFDIDVIYPLKIKNKTEVIWPIFEKLRVKKNQIFNDGITEDTKKLIK